MKGIDLKNLRLQAGIRGNHIAQQFEMFTEIVWQMRICTDV